MSNQIEKKRDKITKETLARRIESKLFSRGVTDPAGASAEQVYQATVSVLKDLIARKRSAFKKRVAAKDAKRVCYLCMEFLVGRALKNDAVNLGVYDELCSILSDFGSSFDKVFACEVDRADLGIFSENFVKAFFKGLNFFFGYGTIKNQKWS